MDWFRNWCETNANQFCLYGCENTLLAPLLVGLMKDMENYHRLGGDHPETVPIAFLELSLKSAGFLAHGIRLWFVLSFLLCCY